MRSHIYIHSHATTCSPTKVSEFQDLSNIDRLVFFLFSSFRFFVAIWLFMTEEHCTSFWHILFIIIKHLNNKIMTNEFSKQKRINASRDSMHSQCNGNFRFGFKFDCSVYEKKRDNWLQCYEKFKFRTVVVRKTSQSESRFVSHFCITRTTINVGTK